MFSLSRMCASGLWFVFLITLLPAAHADSVRVAVAANFLATLKAIKPVYEKDTGHELIISSASTGSLYAQIINGAPYDVLLSADQDYPRKLEHAGKIIAGSRFVYAQGQLVLWTRNPRERMTADLLVSLLDKQLAVANPRTAPYGRAAAQVLERILGEKAQNLTLLQGHNINQAFQFVATGNARLGLVALSQVLNPNNTDNRDNYWKVPPDYYHALAQEAALLSYGRNNSAAKQFLTYLKNKKARQIMTGFGYL